MLGCLFVALVFIAMPCYQYFSDGLVDAYDIETQAGWIVRPHHALYPLLPQFIFRALGGLTSGITGLGLLHAWSVFFGIAGCIAAALTLRAAGFSLRTVFAGLGLFAFSNGVWYFSTTPNQNSAALAFHVITLSAIVGFTFLPLKARKTPFIILMALLVIAAISFSELNAVLILPALFVVSVGGNKDRWPLVLIFLLTVIVVGICVFLLLVVWLKGITDLNGFLEWQHSYITSARYWALGLSESLTRSWRGELDLHLAPAANSYTNSAITGFPGVLAEAGRILVLAFIFITTLRGLISWLRSRCRKPAQTIGILSALPIFIFSFIFTPDWFNYRILYLPGWILLIAPVLESDFKQAPKPAFKAAIIWLAVALLILLNLTLKFAPCSNPASNPYLSEAHALAGNFGPHDRIVYLSAMDDDYRIKYTRYFTQCSVTRVIDLVAALRRDPAEVERFFRSSVENGGVVVVHDDVLNSPEKIEWVNQRYRVDIQPTEMADFFGIHFIELEEIEVAGQVYHVLTPVKGYAGAG